MSYHTNGNLFSLEFSFLSVSKGDHLNLFFHVGENGSPRATALSPSMHGPGPRADYSWGSVQGCLKEGEPGNLYIFIHFLKIQVKNHQKVNERI